MMTQPPSKAISTTVYSAIFFALYAVLAKTFVAPYILLDANGAALTFGESGLACWASFTLMLALGLPWARSGGALAAVVSAIISALTAAGFCVLGYSLSASPIVAPALIGICALAFLLAIRAQGLGVFASIGAAVAAPMCASLILFAVLLAGALPLEGISDNDDAGAALGELRQLANEELRALGIIEANVVARPLPKNEVARYDHESNAIVLSAASLMGYSSREELAVGVLHALAHQSQASLPETQELWPDLRQETVNAWLEESGGSCPSDESADEYGPIEGQARDYALRKASAWAA